MACALAGVALAGCGGGKVSAEEYAVDVCRAGARWIEGIQSRTTSLREVLAPGTTPQEGQRVLRDYLDGVLALTEDALAALEEAGTPDVPDGGEFAKTLISAMKTARGALEDASDEVSALPTDDPEAFGEGAQHIAATVNAALSEAGRPIGEAQTPELRQAFSEEPTCRRLSQ